MQPLVDYRAELRALSDAPKPYWFCHSRVLGAEDSRLGGLLLQYERDITRGKGFERRVETRDGYADVVFLEVVARDAVRVLDVYYEADAARSEPPGARTKAAATGARVASTLERGGADADVLFKVDAEHAQQVIEQYCRDEGLTLGTHTKAAVVRVRSRA